MAAAGLGTARGATAGCGQAGDRAGAGRGGGGRCGVMGAAGESAARGPSLGAVESSSRELGNTACTNRPRTARPGATEGSGCEGRAEAELGLGAAQDHAEVAADISPCPGEATGLGSVCHACPETGWWAPGRPRCRAARRPSSFHPATALPRGSRKGKRRPLRRSRKRIL